MSQGQKLQASMSLPPTYDTKAGSHHYTKSLHSVPIQVSLIVNIEDHVNKRGDSGKGNIVLKIIKYGYDGNFKIYSD
jgi:hypothetical protein